MTTNDLIASGKLPDFAIRLGIRHRLAGTIAPFENLDPEDRQAKLMAHIAELKAMPIAIATEEANEQHYELPTAFFKRCLGPHMKYSSGYWDPGVTDIGEIGAGVGKGDDQRRLAPPDVEPVVHPITGRA